VRKKWNTYLARLKPFCHCIILSGSVVVAVVVIFGSVLLSVAIAATLREATSWLMLRWMLIVVDATCDVSIPNNQQTN
jgi:hypothetical protein